MTNFWIEKFNIDNLSEIDNIDKLNSKNFKSLKCFDFDNNMYGKLQPIYDGTIDLENINIISEGDIDYDISQLKIFQNTRLIIKMSEVQLFTAGNSVEIEKIPKIFFDKKNLIIIKNLNDHKCPLYCYIRKHLNPIDNNVSRVNKKILKLQKN